LLYWSSVLFPPGVPPPPPAVVELVLKLWANPIAGERKRKKDKRTFLIYLMSPENTAVALAVLVKQPVVEKTIVMPVLKYSGGLLVIPIVELAATATHLTGVTAPSAGADVALNNIT
jgi:hypothetical protein